MTRRKLAAKAHAERHSKRKQAHETGAALAKMVYEKRMRLIKEHTSEMNGLEEQPFRLTAEGI